MLWHYCASFLLPRVFSLYIQPVTLMGIDELHTSWMNSTEWRMGKWGLLLHFSSVLCVEYLLAHMLVFLFLQINQVVE